MNSVCFNRRRVLSTEYNLLGMHCGGERRTSEKRRCRYEWEGQMFIAVAKNVARVGLRVGTNRGQGLSLTETVVGGRE